MRRHFPATLATLGCLGGTVAGAGCHDQVTLPDSNIAAACGEPGSICTVAGNGEASFNGDGQPAQATGLYWPVDVELGPDGRAYVMDWQNHRVRRIDADGAVRTVIGTDGIGDGPVPGSGDETIAPGVLATSINLNHPTDLQLSPDGSTLFLAAWHNHKLRTLDMTTGLAVIACGRGPGYAGDGGPEAMALFNQPKSIALAPSGDLFVLDTRNFRIRRIAADTGTITTVAGAGTRGSGGDGGDPLAAQFSFQADGDNPEPGGGLALDGQGRLYVADTQNHRVRRIDLAGGSVETVAGTGMPGAGGDGGPATAAELAFPRDVELGPDGRLFIADTENHQVRVVDLATGVIDRVAGNGSGGFTGDGGPAREAELRRPFGIGVDAQGDLYVADTLNNRVRKVVRP